MPPSPTNARTIAITGCSRGLGRALVEEFVAGGHLVAGCSRSEDQLQSLRDACPGGHHFQVVDVSDDASVKAWSDALQDVVGVPDLLINNAAIINEPAVLWDVPPTEFQSLININVVGVFHVIRHLLPPMIERGTGVVVNLSSGWGRSVDAKVAPYCASKWAVEGLTRALAAELPAGLAAIPMNPGVIDTDMLRVTWGEGAGDTEKASAWARRVAPYLLGLSASHNGQSLNVPG